MKLIQVPHFHDERGHLAVIDQVLPFAIQRVFTLYDVKTERGGHGHFVQTLAIYPVGGELKIEICTEHTSQVITLNKTHEILIIEPNEWHRLFDFTPGTSAVVLCSDSFDKKDYFYEKPYRV
jgi:hypothetical protein